MSIEWSTSLLGFGRSGQITVRGRMSTMHIRFVRAIPAIENEVTAEPVAAPSLAGRGRVAERWTPFMRTIPGFPAIEDEVPADPVAPPDATVRALRGHVRRSAVGSIRLLHQVPPIPPSLTRTGSLIVYFLRWKLSRSPPPRLLSVSWECRREFLDYIVQARHTVSRAYDMLQIGDAVFGRGCRNTEDGSRADLPCRKTIAYCIMRSLLVLQAITENRIYHCLLCDQAPALERRPPRSVAETNGLEVRCSRLSGLPAPFGYFPINHVYVLPPIGSFAHQPLLCGLHRYVFQFLVYQNVNPSWPVPHLQQDRDRYGEIDVPRWNPATQTVHFEEPRRRSN